MKPGKPNIDPERLKALLSKIKVAEPGADLEGYSMVCSGCYQVFSGTQCHVIPWWNDTLENFVTTYRCDKCWLTALDETAARVANLDTENRDCFTAFMQRHKFEKLADDIQLAELPEASKMCLMWLEKLRARTVVLKP